MVVPDAPGVTDQEVRAPARAMTAVLFGPADFVIGLAEPLGAAWVHAVRDAVASPEFREFAQRARVTPGLLPPAGFAAALRRDRDLYRALIPAPGLS